MANIKKMFVGTVLFIGLFLSTLSCNKLNSISNIPKTNMSVSDLANMSEEDVIKIKDQETVKMLTDTALAYGIKPYIFIGLAWHESDKFKQAGKRRRDSNNRYSYSLFQVQLETAVLYEKDVTTEKLLAPKYNSHIAAIIFCKNLYKYKGNYEFAIAAHNAGSIHNDRITNNDFVKKVYSSIGEVAVLYNIPLND